MPNELPEAMKRTIFADLVAAQDEGHPVRESRLLVAARHNLDVAVIRSVEAEGLEHEWPPL